jgi:hypothetical protein
MFTLTLNERKRPRNLTLVLINQILSSCLHTSYCIQYPLKRFIILHKAKRSPKDIHGQLSIRKFVDFFLLSFLPHISKTIYSHTNGLWNRGGQLFWLRGPHKRQVRYPRASTFTFRLEYVLKA